jgi:hypothetical protein
MSYQHYTLVRLERELSLQIALARAPVPRRPRRPRGPRRPRRSLRPLRARIPLRRCRPLLAPQQYLELEFIVDDRR